ncbi:MAG TPA: glucosaminidase domain-containing protein [Longimicrobium sp.]|nr:glucosaminidase domain-containing protein [Longimicrobium sp.]
MSTNDPNAAVLSHPLLAGDAVLQAVAAAAKPPLHATGKLVAGMGAVQDALNHLAARYPDLRVNVGAAGQFRGFFGEQTKQAVRNFQATHALQADGTVGKDTLRALDAALRSFDANGGVDQTRTAAPAPQPSPAGFRTAFIQMVVPFAQACARSTGVPASVTIAQAALESDFGRSGLTLKAKNFFGMKGTGPAGSVDMPTKEEIGGKMVTVIAQFRAYNSFQESCDDHADRIAHGMKGGKLIYAEAMKHTGDARKFAGALEGVYATDSKYAEKLWGMMDTFQLEQYDV